VVIEQATPHALYGSVVTAARQRLPLLMAS
jgi:hypothetical protein